ncbi:hypothetical protein J3P71_19345 [Rhizobium leguminosarum]|uniref:colicin E5-related ribonuclease n=1 Tax=Rhizobium leguminosarum TaxID=384 RepID=UPI001440FA9D|nr:colicin E5-related ribonuclease [Rhizobium leguminosarum]MBY5841090.1 hypothetical protein [Rhizobium leguminosarum]NKM80409.1 hypothetical protein [Rhizobium leguminosarum bv. viciae]QSZ07012.1 hypothetical protein J3P71_19345 [Rhizobium leguminosarum]
MRFFQPLRLVLTLFFCTLMIWVSQAEAGKVFHPRGRETRLEDRSKDLEVGRRKESESSTKSEKWLDSELPNKPRQDFRDAAKLGSTIKEQNGKKDVVIIKKIRDQMTERHWTEREISELAKTNATGRSIDNTGRRNSPATVYGTPTRYIVVNDFTRQVVQISGGFGWKADPRITWKDLE